jgi:hypothetical protein
MHENKDLPVHPVTGIRAIGVIAGRPVWPDRRRRPTAIETLERRRDELDAEIDALIAAPIPRRARRPSRPPPRRSPGAPRCASTSKSASGSPASRRPAGRQRRRAEQLAAGSDPTGPPARVTSEPRTYGET